MPNPGFRGRHAEDNTAAGSRSLFFDRITAVYKAIAPEKRLFFFFIVL